MRLGIDCRELMPPLKGIANYLINILKELETMSGQDEVFLYAHKDFPWKPSNPLWVKRTADFNGLSTLWMMTQGRSWVIADRLDVFWSPWPLLPLFMPMKCAITIHDFVWKYYPETMHPSQLYLYNILSGYAIKRADAIFTISASTSKDILGFYPKACTPVLTLCAANKKYIPMDRKDVLAQVRQRFNIPKKFILYVGTIEPRKNLVNLFRAFDLVYNATGGAYILLVVGAKGWQDTEILKAYQELKMASKSMMMGYLSEEDLALLYNSAECFVFPSFYEGFGIPPLEAMACGCPVVVSDRPALPEVVADAGIIVDPISPPDIAEKILKLLHDDVLNQQCRAKGLLRSKDFSWEASAAAVLKVLRKLSC